MPPQRKKARRRRKIWEPLFLRAADAPKIFRGLFYFRPRIPLKKFGDDVWAGVRILNLIWKTIQGQANEKLDIKVVEFYPIFYSKMFFLHLVNCLAHPRLSSIKFFIKWLMTELRNYFGRYSHIDIKLQKFQLMNV